MHCLATGVLVKALHLAQRLRKNFGPMVFQDPVAHGNQESLVPLSKQRPDGLKIGSVFSADLFDFRPSRERFHFFVNQQRVGLGFQGSHEVAVVPQDVSGQIIHDGQEITGRAGEPEAQALREVAQEVDDESGENPSQEPVQSMVARPGGRVASPITSPAMLQPPKIQRSARAWRSTGGGRDGGRPGDGDPPGPR